VQEGVQINEEIMCSNKIDMHMDGAPLEIRLFGAMSVSVRGEPMAKVRTRSVEWLLALLCLRQGRPVNRSWLAGTLWPESEETRALENLRHDLVSLKKALGEEGSRLESPSRDTLRLNLDGSWCDVVEFDRAVQKGDSASLKSAVEIYVGSLLEGCHKEWAIGERESRSERCIRALQELSGLESDKGQYVQAIGLLRRAEALDPLRDSTIRSLMENLSSDGDPGAAIEVYRNFSARLHNELHTSPDNQTSELILKIRARAHVRHRRAPTDGSPAWQSGRFKAPPYGLSKLVGREEEIERLQQVLLENRLVTLIGAGGVGKTRVAMELALRARQTYGGRVAWVDLGQIDDQSMLIGSVAAALGIEQTQESDEVAIQRILETLQSAPVLLALDNCEHLMEGVAATAETLLAASQDLHMLTTSRQRLGLSGEIAWRVPSLDAPDPAQLPDLFDEALELAKSYPAAALFLERAQSVRPGFKIGTTGELAALCSICRRLDGIPLALELAAARISTLGVESIDERLSDRFSLLTSGSRTALPRQRTLKALIAWSYDLLSAEESGVLERLSVFSGGWTLEAAEACLGANCLALDVLSSLCDKSLVSAESEASGIRYRMLETVREYAFERLEASGQAYEARLRHAEHFIELARRHCPALVLERSEAVAQTLNAEAANLGGTLAWTKSESRERFAELVAEVWPYWVRHGSVFEGCVHVQSALDMEEESGAVREKLLRGARELISWLHSYQGELAERSAPSIVGSEVWLQGYRKSQEVLERALDLQRRLERKADMVVTLRCMRMLAEAEGEHEDSVSYARRAVAISRELDNRFYGATTLHEAGCVMYRLEEFSESNDLLTEALALFQLPGGRYGRAFCANNLAIAKLKLGDREGSAQLNRDALVLYMEDSEWDGMAWSLAGISDSAFGLEEAAIGMTLLGALQSIHRERPVNEGLRERAAIPFTEVLGERASLAASSDGFEMGAGAAIAKALEFYRSLAKLGIKAKARAEVSLSPIRS
jgi:predicted ATPase/DNA-binding SARP family transcriptional activator